MKERSNFSAAYYMKSNQCDEFQPRYELGGGRKSAIADRSVVTHAVNTASKR